MILQVCYSYCPFANVFIYSSYILNLISPFLLFLYSIVQKRGYVDLQGAADAVNGPCCYGYTLPKDSSCTVPSTWAMTDPTTFLIRGETYLHDRLKVAYMLQISLPENKNSNSNILGAKLVVVLSGEWGRIRLST